MSEESKPIKFRGIANREILTAMGAAECSELRDFIEAFEALQTENEKLLSALKEAAVELKRISKIRSLPLTDINDTDEELAKQYSSVIDTLVYIANKALAKLKAQVPGVLGEL